MCTWQLFRNSIKQCIVCIKGHHKMCYSYGSEITYFGNSCFHGNGVHTIIGPVRIITFFFSWKGMNQLQLLWIDKQCIFSIKLINTTEKLQAQEKSTHLQKMILILTESLTNCATYLLDCPSNPMHTKVVFKNTLLFKISLFHQLIHCEPVSSPVETFVSLGLFSGRGLVALTTANNPPCWTETWFPSNATQDVQPDLWLKSNSTFLSH